MFRPAALIVALSLLPFHGAQGMAAEDYPVKSIRFIVPFAPGGTNDIVARLVAGKLHETMGQSVVVDNRGGAGGIIGTDIAAKAAPDGYTLLMANVNLATNPALVKKLPYDSIKDFAAVSLLAISPTVLATHPTLPVKSVAEFIAYAKANPGKLNYSTSGPGTTTHIAMALLISMAGIKMEAIHYKGGGPALIDLIGGHVSCGFTTIMSVIPHLKANRLRALAVSTTKRSSVLPDIPTVSEAGVAGYEFTGWWGMVVPAGTPHSIVSKLNANLAKILAQDDMREKFIGEGADPQYTTPEEYSSYIRSEIAKWARIMKEAGIRAK